LSEFKLYDIILAYMALRCANCGKGVMYGHNVSHAKNRTRKIFKPNLHSAKITVGTTSKRVKLCTKCLRTLKSHIRKPEIKAIEVAEVAPIVAAA
jgi:large subunit ribosomal protein L28